MELYSPNRKNVQCFKKNTFKKAEVKEQETDEGIMVNRIQKNEIIFDLKKQTKKTTTHDETSFVEKFSSNMRNLFYNRVRIFFDYEDSDLSLTHKNDCR